LLLPISPDVSPTKKMLLQHYAALAWTGVLMEAFFVRIRNNYLTRYQIDSLVVVCFCCLHSSTRPAVSFSDLAGSNTLQTLQRGVEVSHGGWWRRAIPP